jgi:hypothetical protein
MVTPGSDHLGVLALAVVLLLPALGAAWKAASWRGDIFRKWADRVDIAHAGLSERAKDELAALQGQLAEALGTGAQFTPAGVWANPDPLVAGATHCANLLRARDRLRGRFQRHRQLGLFLIPTLLAYGLGWLAATLYFTEAIHEFWTKLLGFALGGLAAAAAGAIFVFYAYFEAKLTAAEEMAAGARP